MEPISVIIIEPITPIRIGLRYILESHQPEFSVTGSFRDIASFRESACAQADIILVNTSAVGFSVDFDIRKILPRNTTSLLIAMTCELLLPDARNSFDGVLNLYEEETAIVENILKIHTSRARAANTESIPILSLREKKIITDIFNGLKNK
jgi:DNA-binding NarL/FixJ family response regulator